MSENEMIKRITIDDVERRIAQYTDDTQLMSEGDAISFEQSISTVYTFGTESGLTMNSCNTQAVLLWNRRRSFTRYLPHIEMDWNKSKFKILGVWFILDLTGCEEINYKIKFFEMKMLFDICI